MKADWIRPENVNECPLLDNVNGDCYYPATDISSEFACPNFLGINCTGDINCKGRETNA